MASRMAGALLVLVGLGAAGPGFAQDSAPAAKVVAVGGALLARTEGKGWRPVSADAALADGTQVLALFDAELRAADGAVALKLLADVGQRGPLPVLEAAITLHRSAGHALDLTLDRGLLILTNERKDGPASVRLRVRDEAVEVTLKDPGTKLAVEVYGRHPPGAPGAADTKKDDPVLHVFCIALEGEAFLKNSGKGYRLHAPPGPAVMVWDSVITEPEVNTLDKLPDYARPDDDAEKAALARMNEQAKVITAKKIGPALAAAIRSDDALERKVAVTIMGALDELPQLAAVLALTPHRDTRDHAILVLRHWLGRGPGQSAKLYAGLVKTGLTEPQAKTVLHLLYGFTPDEQARPSTYDLLLDALGHSRPGVRALAHWHLVRLAPSGRDIPFDPVAPPAARQASIARWRALIPAGQVPRTTTGPDAK